MCGDGTRETRMAERALMGPRGACVWAVGLAAFLSLAARSEPAFSQAASGGPSAAELSDALFAEGKALRKAGRKAEAREKYVGALLLKKSYDVAGNLGSLELELGMFRDAAEHLAFAVRTYASSGSTAEQVARARKLLAEAKKHVTTVKVAVNVRGAEVFVDGKSVGFAPLEDDLFVEPGTRVFEAKLAGHVTARETIEAVKGGERGVALALSPLAAEGRPEGKGPVRVEGPRPALPTEKGGASSSAEAPMERPGEGPRKGLIITGIATSAVAVGAGVVFAIVSAGRGSDADGNESALLRDGGPKACKPPSAFADRCATLDSDLAARDTFANMALWSFIVGGAVGAGTTAYALATSPSAGSAAVRAAPVVSATGGGLVVMGRW